LSQPPAKGSIESALSFWSDQAPDLEHTVNGLLKDIYNFQAAGAGAPVVQRSLLLKDGRILRIYGSLS